MGRFQASERVDESISRVQVSLDGRVRFSKDEPWVSDPNRNCADRDL
ncbi:hypothetical protein A2U01_0041603, partial [Trifolium medium]|nr:hypothetical protein [Trifolium medium]